MYSRLNKMLLMFVLATLLLPVSLFAGTKGKVTGVVKDKETGEPLPGVNIIIQGTAMGAATDDNGEFLIISVPSGVYSVTANMIGYSVLRRNNVRVLPDFTTRLSFDLVAEDIGGEEVVIIAERPLLQKDQTMTLSVTSGDEIKALPIRGFQSAANLGVGIVVDATTRNLEGGTGNVNIRGGRPNETGVFLDGFLQNNLITGSDNTKVANSAIEEVIVITGGFSAEFGRNQSGIIQVITKSGGEKYSGTLEGVTDAGIGDALAQNYGYNVLSGSIGGPLMPGNDKIKFFISGEGEQLDDAEPGVFGFPKFKKLNSVNGIPDSVAWNFDGNGNPVFEEGPRPDNSLDNGINSRKNAALQAKITFNVTPTFKLDVNANYQQLWRRIFDNRQTLNDDNVERREITTLNLGATGTYTLNERSFIDVGINYYDYERQRFTDARGFNLNAYEGSDVGITQNRTYLNDRLFYDYPGGGTGGSARLNPFRQDDDTYYAFKINYVNQLNKNHQLKVGGDMFLHEIRFLDLEVLEPVGGQNDNIGWTVVGGVGTYKLKEISGDNLDNGVLGPASPWSSALYVRDKIEYEGFIVDAGMRVDFFNPGVKRVRDFLKPLGADGVIGSEDFVSGKTDVQYSPRLSVSFPVSEKTVFRLSYGRFFQQPNLQDLYVSPEFLAAEALRGGSATVLGNPNLEPEKSTQYEVGFRRLLSEKVALDVNAYYKDITNLVNVRSFNSDPNALIITTNNDIGIIKGINLAVEMRRTGKLSGRVSYTIQQATGSGSDETSAFRQAWLSFEETRIVAPLNFDQRHSITAFVDLRNGKDQGPMIGGNKLLEEAGLNLLVRTGSGFPYTPVTLHRIIIGGVPGERPTGRRNSQYMPWTFRVDLKADKTIRFGDSYSANLYVEVLNLLDRKNVTFVHEHTGDADDDGFLDSTGGQALTSTARDQYQVRLVNNFYYDTPRQARLGVIFNF